MLNDEQRFEVNLICDGLEKFNFFDKNNIIDSINYITRNRCNFTFHSYDNLDENKLYYFVLNFNYYPFDNFLNDLNENKEYKKIIDIINRKNVKTIFVIYHESSPIEHIKLFNKVIRNKNIKEDNIFYISNDLNIFNILNENDIKIKSYKSNHLAHSFPNLFPNSEIKNTRKYLFLTKNNNPKIHRFLLLCYLKKLNLLNETNYSFLSKIDYTGIQKILKKKEIENLDFKYFENIFPKMTEFESIKFKNSFIDIQNFAGTFEQNDYESAYINITTESQFFGKCIHITEKSFKPFYFYQIPIFLATHNHVKSLKEFYGFDLFDDIIDHSYDLEVDDRKRFFMVIEEIQRISSIKSKLEETFINIKNRLDNNKKICQSLNKDELDLKNFIEIYNTKI
jgi:hypothetical protein